jgi:predicted nucleic acid-binding protein
MGRTVILFDTNILIDFLSGVPEAKRALDKNPRAAISVITWMETLVGARTEHEQEVIRALLDRFEVVPLSPSVAERAVGLRREHRLRLPDAVILASAQELGCTLWTRNVKDFPAKLFRIHVPYP